MLQTVRILVKTIETNLIWRTFSIIHIANVNRLVTPITLGDRQLCLLKVLIFCHVCMRLFYTRACKASSKTAANAPCPIMSCFS